jgi:hypothetical protein
MFIRVVLKRNHLAQLSSLNHQVVIKQQLENTLKLVDRQGKYLLKNLTPIADFRMKCLMEEQKLKTNITGNIHNFQKISPVKSLV